jgi:hypothetical protein
VNYPRLKFPRSIALAAIVTGGLLITGLAGFRMSLFITRHRAERLLREVKALKLGESTAQDAQSLIDRYGGLKQAENDSICSGGDCAYYRIFVYNSILEHLLRARRYSLDPSLGRENLCCELMGWRFLGVGINVKNDKIMRIEIVVGARRKDGFIIEGETEIVPSIPEPLEALRQGYRPSKFHITTPGGGEGLKAIVTPRATNRDLDRAFGLNLQCMSSIRGCEDLRELMPSVWADYRE